MSPKYVFTWLIVNSEGLKSLVHTRVHEELLSPRSRRAMETPALVVYEPELDGKKPIVG